MNDVVPDNGQTQILPLDLNFCDLPHTIASYLVIGPGGPVLVETGPASTLGTLLEGLSSHGIEAGDVRDVLVTHIHLDHSGAAGWWAQNGARVYVHHVGAPHLIAPERLLASAGRIYGDMMDRLWGQTVPAPEENVVAVSDGDRIEVAGLVFEALDTPGHAGHHHVLRLGSVAFTGDAAGIRLPGSSFVVLPTPPPEFQLELWLTTVQRLRELGLERLYPTHFGPVDEPNEHLGVVAALLEETVKFVTERLEDGMSRGELVRQYMAWNRERATAESVSSVDLMRYECVNPSAMSVDGIIRYWRKKASQSEHD